MWWKQRRPEIPEAFAREVYGRLPENIPDVNWEVVVTEREFMGWIPVIARKVIGHVDHSLYPLIDADISMVVVTPAWRQHDGGHSDTPNMKYFIEWVNKHIG